MIIVGHESLNTGACSVNSWENLFKKVKSRRSHLERWSLKKRKNKQKKCIPLNSLLRVSVFIKDKLIPFIQEVQQNSSMICCLDKRSSSVNCDRSAPKGEIYFGTGSTSSLHKNNEVRGHKFYCYWSVLIFSLFALGLIPNIFQNKFC